ncbi:Cof-type HAD-IIB family hydrolase [Clostridium estertheticum]|uniref:Cof-type HAD-IIB family hydrolase n=1 Tax=Clostridium estertheticum TaxID=238834 RepID=UPI00217E153F|nr:Cof-type HAD-IIB family hydrolase [Clostridium estertheticum]
MYKLIVSDLDDTLLNDDHEICVKNIQAIKKASELGIKFVPASGRGYKEIEKILTNLDLKDKEQQYVISFNGGAITESKDNKIVRSNYLSFKKANELFQVGITKDVCIQVHTSDTIFIYNFNEVERNRMVKLNMNHMELKKPSIEFLRDIPIAKIIYINVDINYLRLIKNEIKLITKDSITVSYSANCCMEFNKHGINKGEAMLALAGILGIKQEEIIAIGDRYNDMTMLAMAGLSVAAGNAVGDVKNACTYICKSDNNEGVLAEVIERFILKNLTVSCK